MRLPKYRESSSPSLGGAYTDVITSGQPALRQPGQRNIANYLIDPKAGQRDLQAEAGALASKAYIGQALSKGLTKVASAFYEADGATDYGKQTDQFRFWNLGQISYYKNEPFIRQNPDYDPLKRDETNNKYLPTFPNMLSDYKDNVRHQIEARASLITHTGFRAKFVKESITKAESTHAQLMNYQSTKHIGWLHGEVDIRLNKALQLYEVDDILASGPALGSMNLKEIEENRVEYKRLVANRFLQEIMQNAWDDPLALAMFQENVQFGGYKKYDENGVVSWEYVEPYTQMIQFLKKGPDGDQLKWIKKAQDRMDEIDQQAVLISKRSIGEEALKILKGTYDEDQLKAWVVAHPLATEGQITSLRSLLKSKGDVLVGDINTFADMRENIEDYSVTDIVGDSTLDHAQKTTLIEKRLAMEKGALMWESSDHPSGPWGKRALGRLKRAFRIEGLDPTDPKTFMAGAAGAAVADRLNKYHDAVTDLEDYLYGPNHPDGRNFTEAEMPKAAWDWVKDNEEGFKGEVADTPSTDTAGNVTPAASTKSNFEKWQNENSGHSWTLEKINDLPPGVAKDRLIQRLSEYGVHLDKDAGGKSLQQFLDDDEGTAEDWYHKYVLGPKVVSNQETVPNVSSTSAVIIPDTVEVTELVETYRENVAWMEIGSAARLTRLKSMRAFYENKGLTNDVAAMDILIAETEAQLTVVTPTPDETDDIHVEAYLARLKNQKAFYENKGMTDEAAEIDVLITELLEGTENQ